MASLTLPRPHPPGRGRLAQSLEATGVGLLLALAGLTRWLRLDTYTGSFDEGIRSQQLLLMAAGYRPFADIFASQGPLLLDLLYPPFLLFGQTLEAARSGVALLSMVGLVGAWLVVRLVAGPIAGLAVIGLLLLSPGYLEGSRLALAEVPTIAPALLAIATLLLYRRSHDRRWLVVSAACCALALLIKPMVVHLGVPLIVLLVAPGRSLRSLRRVAVDLALYGAVVGVLCGLTIVALGPADVWDSLGAYRSGAGRRFGSSLAENLRLTANVLARERIGFFAVAGVGLLLGLWHRPIETTALGLWAAAVLAFFAGYTDLADKHIIYFVPPLALLGAIGVGRTAELLDAARTAPAAARGRLATWGGAGLGALGLVVYASQAPQLYRADRFLIFDAEKVAIERRDRPRELDMAEVMHTAAAPDDWVLSDDPNAAFRARRLVIPSLVDTSGTRVDAGSLTSAKASEAVARYRPAVIVTWRGRLGRLDDFVRGLSGQGYRLDRSYENGWHLYVRT